MHLGSKVRETVDRITAAADDTKQAITVIGALAALALGVALLALVLASRRRA
jgi:hypothetical protein